MRIKKNWEMGLTRQNENEIFTETGIFLKFFSEICRVRKMEKWCLVYASDCTKMKYLQKKMRALPSTYPAVGKPLDPQRPLQIVVVVKEKSIFEKFVIMIFF